MRALQDGERRFQAEGRRGGGVLEQIVESEQCAGGQLVDAVIHFGGVFGLCSPDGGLELGLVANPMVDGGTVDAGLFGCGADGLPLSQGLDDLSLNRRQGGI
jgi:hypothetical protein